MKGKRRTGRGWSEKPLISYKGATLHGCAYLSHQTLTGNEKKSRDRTEERDSNGELSTNLKRDQLKKVMAVKTSPDETEVVSPKGKRGKV